MVAASSTSLSQAPECRFEDVARNEAQTGPEAYKCDYERWRAAFPDGTLKIVNVIVDGEWALVEFVNRGHQTGPLESSLGTFPPIRSVHGGPIRQRYARARRHGCRGSGRLRLRQHRPTTRTGRRIGSRDYGVP